MRKNSKRSLQSSVPLISAIYKNEIRGNRNHHFSSNRKKKLVMVIDRAGRHAPTAACRTQGPARRRGRSTRGVRRATLSITIINVLLPSFKKVIATIASYYTNSLSLFILNADHCYLGESFCLKRSHGSCPCRRTSKRSAWKRS